MVFQSLALFPHLTCGENVAYALRIRGVGRATRRKRAEELLALVRLPDIADRHGSTALGRPAPARRDRPRAGARPKLFLLDEPLSALDAKLREAMQVELRLLQQRLGISTIVVTHDQREAMTMADIVVVMDHGRVQQVGPPVEIYRNPANAFVADFIGSSNLLPGVVDGRATVTVGGAHASGRARPGAGPGATVTLSVRPEEVHVRPAASRGEPLPGKITFVRDLGASVEIIAGCAATEVAGGDHAARAAGRGGRRRGWRSRCRRRLRGAAVMTPRARRGGSPAPPLLSRP